MGFPVFPNICAGLLPMLIINIAVSITSVKHTLNAFLHVLGLVDLSPALHDATPILFPEEYNLPSGVTYSGLSEEVLQALPVTVCDPNNMNLTDAECPVCLCEFQAGQELRLLPACKHVYHRKCLDRWLDHQHMTCPLCRTSLVPEEIAKKQQRREQQLAEEGEPNSLWQFFYPEAWYDCKEVWLSIEMVFMKDLCYFLDKLVKLDDSSMCVWGSERIAQHLY